MGLSGLFRPKGRAANYAARPLCLRFILICSKLLRLSFSGHYRPKDHSPMLETRLDAIFGTNDGGCRMVPKQRAPPILHRLTPPQKTRRPRKNAGAAAQKTGLGSSLYGGSTLRLGAEKSQPLHWRRSYGLLFVRFCLSRFGPAARCSRASPGWRPACGRFTRPGTSGLG